MTLTKDKCVGCELRERCDLIVCLKDEGVSVRFVPQIPQTTTKV